MRKTHILLVLAGVFALPNASADPAIDAAIANESRLDEHRERDARSHPQVILDLLQLKPGDDVVDVFGGGGYYAELMAAMVIPGGSVVLQNNKPYSRWVEEQIQKRYVDEGVPGISLLMSEVDELNLGSQKFDVAIMVMSYHDLYYNNPDRGWFETDIDLFFSQIHAALKPGGRLMIIDHSAASGSGSSAAQDLHRIDESYAKQEIARNGFKLIASSDVLRNPNDDRAKLVFDKTVRGETDRFVLLFAKE